MIRNLARPSFIAASAIALFAQAGSSSAQAETEAAALPAEVSVDFAQPTGPFLHPERYNNLSRATTFPEQRNADVQFFNEIGLHGHTYRVWVDAERINEPGTDSFNYEGIEDYLADVSRLSDNLLVVMDTRVSIRDLKRTPEQIKPVIKTIMRDLKRRFPQIRYIEAFNEPDHNLAKVISPEQLYDYYEPYYQAVNELNRELQPEVPLELGGPAFMMYNERWLQAFLDRYMADPSPDKRLDFISWHGYGEFPQGGGVGGPEAYHFYKGDPSEVAVQRGKLENELRSRGLDPQIPSFITELGIYPGPSFDHQNDAQPDYLIGAAGVPSLLYWYMDQPHTVPFNWVLRHFGEERKDQLITRASNGKPMSVRAGENKPVPTRILTPYGNALLMMSKLKDQRVQAKSSTLSDGKGVYAIATKDDTGAAVMVWNYQHVEGKSYRVAIKMANLPQRLRGKTLCQRMFRIDNEISNYWGDPARGNLQQISAKKTAPGPRYNLTVELSPNALQLVTLGAEDACGK